MCTTVALLVDIATHPGKYDWQMPPVPRFAVGDEAECSPFGAGYFRCRVIEVRRKGRDAEYTVEIDDPRWDAIGRVFNMIPTMMRHIHAG